MGLTAFFVIAHLFFLLHTSCSFHYKKRTNGLIVLLTDYGLSDYYVGALKGSIYAIYPEARINDITHQICPFEIWEGAYTLSLAAKAFPKGTVFIAVVDPGVGTVRRPIVLETKDGKFFIAPDNGLLTFVAEEMGVCCIREIKNRSYMRQTESFSQTFHGRDIFGPVGAHVAAGVPISALGPERKAFVKFKIPRASVVNGKILGQVLRVDIFGNVVTTIRELHLKAAGIQQGSVILVTLGEQTFSVRFVTTYGDVPKGESLCLLDSQKQLEFAINRGHLAKYLGIRSGDQVVIHGTSKEK